MKSAAGRQVFVWARNRATGAPVEGARVLATDGTTVFAEGVTGQGRRLPPRHRPHGPARPRAEGRPPRGHRVDAGPGVRRGLHEQGPRVDGPAGLPAGPEGVVPRDLPARRRRRLRRARGRDGPRRPRGPARGRGRGEGRDRERPRLVHRRLHARRRGAARRLVDPGARRRAHVRGHVPRARVPQARVHRDGHAGEAVVQDGRRGPGDRAARLHVRRAGGGRAGGVAGDACPARLRAVVRRRLLVVLPGRAVARERAPGRARGAAGHRRRAGRGHDRRRRASWW